MLYFGGSHNPVMQSSPIEVTKLLNEWRNGNPAALEQLMPVVYAELHKLARRHMQRQNPSHTLQTTALIHEAYLRLAGDSRKPWENRAQFYCVAAKAMRHVLVDHARARQAAKLGGGWQAVPLDEGIAVSDERLAGLIALDEALSRLSKLHPAAERSDRAALFWRAGSGRDGDDPPGLSGNGDARLARRQGVAAQRARPQP